MPPIAAFFLCVAVLMVGIVVLVLLRQLQRRLPAEPSEGDDKGLALPATGAALFLGGLVAAVAGRSALAGILLLVGAALLIWVRVVDHVSGFRRTERYRDVAEATGSDSHGLVLAALPFVVFLGSRALGFSLAVGVGLAVLAYLPGRWVRHRYERQRLEAQPMPVLGRPGTTSERP